MKIKHFLATSALTAGLALAASAQANEITVVSWGGAYTKSQVEAYHKPWVEKTGNKIVSEDYNGGIAEIKAQVEAGNVTWDIVDVELSDAIRACDEGLLETIDPGILPAGADGTPAEQDFIEGTLHECAVANIVWTTIFAYDSSKIADGPTTMADFFDLEKFPGKRGLRKGAKINLEFALLADGEVAMTTAYNGRIFNAVAGEDKPFEIVWDGHIWDLDLWVIPKGTPNKELAMDFLAFSTATEQLAKQASYISYGPARKSSAPLVGKFHNKDIDMGPQMPTAPENLTNATQNNFDFWADNADQLNERFNAWLTN